MRDRFFLDTNIFVYTFDSREPKKQAKAQDLVADALTRGRGVISHQVVQEFLHVATQKFTNPLSESDALLYLDRVLGPLCEVLPTLDLYRSTIGLAARWKYSFYDSLIVAAALKSECAILYTEDLKHGQEVEGVTLMNPFLKSAK
ncbi:MAG: PIN domain-containing protein [Acidobacteria bacterium]|nr:MAG: PIN domain-containing protein [Acidobacteriota bacterium]